MHEHQHIIDKLKMLQSRLPKQSHFFRSNNFGTVSDHALISNYIGWWDGTQRGATEEYAVQMLHLCNELWKQINA